MASVPNPRRNGATPRTRAARAATPPPVDPEAELAAAELATPRRTRATPPPPPPAELDPAARIRDLYNRLAAPFDPSEVRERAGSFGQPLRYVTALTVRRRLNDVLGFDGWECDIVPNPESVLCRLTLHLPTRSVTRADLGGYPDMPSNEDRVKGGASDSFKRAAACFGVAAYLADDQAAPPPRAAAPPAPDGGLEDVRDGRSLWRWAKDRNMLQVIIDAGRALGFPPRVVDWNEHEVNRVLDEVVAY
jgi:hypothetical protein